MERTTILKSNRRQTVRLPKAVAFPDAVQEVCIVAEGRTRVITPVEETWDAWFDEPGVSPDFMADREQAAGQVRMPL
ncbi:MAG: AbrB/MazE/SpoVT family DNA-binding domain-containing protein [Nevskiaceae bacterium]|nr:MAG: AbrB/MazE/SpoVT family DNA-binding domain-containing protein [Nevskiaceae bacterium]TBR73414.1 MAG: AbrB/MazE/SpoVT family DNA-binding domain-containing protein [Nevskiaceae bacterium]